MDREKPIRYFRCFGSGHRCWECVAPDKSSLCVKCGEKEHKKRMPKRAEMLYLIFGVGKISGTSTRIAKMREELKKCNMKVLQLNKYRRKMVFSSLSQSQLT